MINLTSVNAGASLTKGSGATCDMGCGPWAAIRVPRGSVDRPIVPPRVVGVEGDAGLANAVDAVVAVVDVVPRCPILPRPDAVDGGAAQVWHSSEGMEERMRRSVVVVLINTDQHKAYCPYSNLASAPIYNNE